MNGWVDEEKKKRLPAKNVGVPFMEPAGLINQAPTKIKKEHSF